VIAEIRDTEPNSDKWQTPVRGLLDCPGKLTVGWTSSQESKLPIGAAIN
jgi:hypothetical protein